MDDLVKRLTETAEVRKRAEPTDDPKHYLNVVAKMSRQDSELMDQAAARIEALEARIAKADALAELAMTFRDYASDAADGILWFESEKDGAKALFQICKKQGKDDLARTDAALAAYREGSDT
jgi:hypothetical protein